MRRFLLAVCATLALAAPLAPALAGGAAAESLHSLFEREWQRDLAENPLLATYRGDRRYDDRLPDLSPAARSARETGDARVLEELAAIPRGELDEADRLNYDLFLLEYRNRAADAPFRLHDYQITARGGPQTLNEITEIMPFATVADYENWLARLAAVPAYLEQYAANLRTAAAGGRTQPRVIMQRVLSQLDMQIVERAEDSPFYEPFREFPQALPDADRERLAARARTMIAGSVVDRKSVV